MNRINITSSENRSTRSVYIDGTLVGEAHVTEHGKWHFRPERNMPAAAGFDSPTALRAWVAQHATHLLNGPAS